MAEESLNCWHCGASLTGVPLPLGRREECAHCTASLHVCRQCDFYDPNVSKDCRETMADEVSDKEAANYCDYFRPRLGLNAKADRAAADARARLEAVFGGSGGETGNSQADKGGNGEAHPEESDVAGEARRKLETLFEDGKD